VIVARGLGRGTYLGAIVAAGLGIGVASIPDAHAQSQYNGGQGRYTQRDEDSIRREYHGILDKLAEDRRKENAGPSIADERLAPVIERPAQVAAPLAIAMPVVAAPASTEVSQVAAFVAPPEAQAMASEARIDPTPEVSPKIDPAMVLALLLALDDDF